MSNIRNTSLCDVVDDHVKISKVYQNENFKLEVEVNTKPRSIRLVEIMTWLCYFIVCVSIFTSQTFSWLSSECCIWKKTLHKVILSKIIVIRTMLFSVFCNMADTVYCRSVNTRSHTGFLENYLPWSNGYSLKDLRDMQMEDKDIGPILGWLETGEKPTSNILTLHSLATRHFVQSWDALVLKNGILMRNFHKKDGSGSFLQLITPKKLQKDILYQMHNGILSGHLGRKKTREKLLQRYYWHGVREDIYLWIEQCENCGANKPPSCNPKAPLGSLNVGNVLDRLSTDFMGPLPETPRGNKYILTVTDHFSRWVEILPVHDQTAETTARVILNEVIARYGCPLTIHSDQGSNYESKLFAELCQLLELKKTRTTSRNPKGNGQVERYHKTLTRMIRAYLADNQTNWDLNLGCLAAAYRATPNETTKMTPNLLMLGREVRLPAEIAFGSHANHNNTVSSYGEYVLKLKEKMQKSHEICREHLGQTAKRQTELNMSGKPFFQYSKGDIVWYLNVKRKEAVCTKLITPYTGPFLIQSKISDQNYVLQLSKSKSDIKVVHYDKLKPYKGSSPPSWIKNIK